MLPDKLPILFRAQLSLKQSSKYHVLEISVSHSHSLLYLTSQSTHNGIATVPKEATYFFGCITWLQLRTFSGWTVALAPYFQFYGLKPEKEQNKQGTESEQDSDEVARRQDWHADGAARAQTLCWLFFWDPWWSPLNVWIISAARASSLQQYLSPLKLGLKTLNQNCP